MRKQIRVNSPNVIYEEDSIISTYEYSNTEVIETEEEYIVKPIKTKYQFKTSLKVPKLGMMIVGWGGSNGATVTAGIIANKHGIIWRTRTGVKSSNFFGSMFQSSTVRIGSEGGRDVYIPFSDLLPSVDPSSIIIGGWDINKANLFESLVRSKVLDFDLVKQLEPYMRELIPLPSIFNETFVASNQSDRADNVLDDEEYPSLGSQVEKIRKDIREFKTNNELDEVIILWSANTERYTAIEPGIHDTWENLSHAIFEIGDIEEISPSTLFAVASILEGHTFINGSPQNTFVPAIFELAERENVMIAGDDFKTGQTKFKSVMVDWLIQAGIKPVSIVSYNHLGNNDGKNLSEDRQFKSKEISKSNVVDDMVLSNSILYDPTDTVTHPDHVVVIKYVPYVGDSKRALDEYTSEIFMGGTNTIFVHNTCEDSLLAAPIILDLVVLAELVNRIQFKKEEMIEYSKFHPVMSILSYMLKAPQVPESTPVINALHRQRAAIENILKACIGIEPENHMYLEHKTHHVKL